MKCWYFLTFAGTCCSFFINHLEKNQGFVKNDQGLSLFANLQNYKNFINKKTLKNIQFTKIALNNKSSLNRKNDILNYKSIVFPIFVRKNWKILSLKKIWGNYIFIILKIILFLFKDNLVFKANLVNCINKSQQDKIKFDGNVPFSII